MINSFSSQKIFIDKALDVFKVDSGQIYQDNWETEEALSDLALELGVSDTEMKHLLDYAQSLAGDGATFEAVMMQLFDLIDVNDDGKINNQDTIGDIELTDYLKDSVRSALEDPTVLREEDAVNIAAVLGLEDQAEDIQEVIVFINENFDEDVDPVQILLQLLFDADGDELIELSEIDEKEASGEGVNPYLSSAQAETEAYIGRNNEQAATARSLANSNQQLANSIGDVQNESTEE